MKKVILLALLLAGSKAWAQPEIKPVGALPSAAQVKWQQLEYYMFIHFGPNTFTDKEWGHGDEDPKVFNPSELDARQWARTAKLAGMKGIIITAKHHDGFCLWPSEYSKHTVRESAWKNGKGDVLAELSAACREYGLLFGVYLSPWDRNHPAYGTPEYNQVFANQLREVHTKYGDVFEQWFDGANGEGPNGKKQVYDWDLFEGTVKKYHPNVIFFSDAGPGCRWIGNEEGYAGTTNWSTLNRADFKPGMGGITQILNKGQEDGTHWVPGEADVSIRPGWFYSASTDNKVKTLPHLLDIYYGSVGRNANLLLNIPVDRRGRIHATDSTRLMELRRALDEDFKLNLARKARIATTNTRQNNPMTSAVYLTDGNYNTYWATEEGKTTGDITLSYASPVTFNRISVQEFIPLGQRVRSFTVSVLEGKEWKEIARETTVGYKRILRLPMITAKSIRVSILDAKASPVISEVALYQAPELIADPIITRDKEGMVSIKTESPDPVIHYTTDGSAPTTASPKYDNPFAFPAAGTVTARAFVNNGQKASATIIRKLGIAPVGWRVLTPGAEAAIDATPRAWTTKENAYPAELVVDMGREQPVKGVSYIPNPRGGIVYKYAVYLSADGKEWGKAVAEGTFANVQNNPIEQSINISSSASYRFVKFVALAPANAEDTRVSVAELVVY
ncbi:alpha-L-fucosidase [Chitinophaga pollutisoli]|uniref:alpha-L-fucosidase n=1 Tax=Chitinophaga pollutisoli TaxID=3133966 RepID=A0ABZ2YTM8_9BACT